MQQISIPVTQALWLVRQPKCGKARPELSTLQPSPTAGNLRVLEDEESTADEKIETSLSSLVKGLRPIQQMQQC